MIAILRHFIFELPRQLRIARLVARAYDLAQVGRIDEACAAYRSLLVIADSVGDRTYSEEIKGRAIRELWYLTGQWDDEWSIVFTFSDETLTALFSDASFAKIVGLQKLRCGR